MGGKSLEIEQAYLVDPHNPDEAIIHLADGSVYDIEFTDEQGIKLLRHPTGNFPTDIDELLVTPSQETGWELIPPDSQEFHAIVTAAISRLRGPINRATQVKHKAL